MSLTKGNLMELTGNSKGVDSAIPNHLVDTMKQLGFDEQEVVYAIAYSYKGNSYGKPINLTLEFIKLLENTTINLKDKDGNQLNLGMNYTLADFIKSLLTKSDKWEIRLK